MRLRKGDEVEVVAGEDRGKRGKILRVVRDKNRVVVEGVSFIKRHSRPTQTNPQGGIVEREAAIHASNVMLVDPRSGRRTRLGMRIAEDGTRERIARKSGEVVGAGAPRGSRGRGRKRS